MTEAATSTRRRYRHTRRRLLVDMQIADWDPLFLSAFEPRMLADATVRAGADGAMVYFHNHLGLCFWPSRSGVQHRAFQGWDPVRESLDAFAEKNIPVCGYYSVNFNNRAWLDHPDWQLKPAAPVAMNVLPRERYGLVCLNRPGYRAFVTDQVQEMLAYQPDAMFFDMLWWNGVCVCTACADRWGGPIPGRIDWRDDTWLRFQTAREEWLAEFARALRDQCKAIDPGIDVYANFALGLSNWTRGFSFATAAVQDFLGGDFYGGRGEQLLTCRLMLNLSESRPPEFMTTVQASLIDHERLRPPVELAQKARTSAANGAAMLIIAAIDPIGTLNPAALNAARDAFMAIEPFESLIGGQPVEDVALYCSDFSRLNPDANGIPLAEAPAGSAPDYPHAKALAGACRILEQGHVLFGVITRKQLAELARYPVIVLADIARLTEEEVAAFRAYLEGGGRLYASGRSLDPLTDLTGCRVAGIEDGAPIYLRPETDLVRNAALPERFVTHRGPAVRISSADGEVLARLSLPYGYPAPGSVTDQNWASIHSSPPWRDAADATIVRKNVGAGELICSAAPIEAGETACGDRLFLVMVRELLSQPILTTNTPGSIAITVFETGQGMTLFLLDREERPWTDPVRIGLRLPAGRRIRPPASTPPGHVLHFEVSGGFLSCDLRLAGSLTAISVQFENEEAR